MFDRCLGGGGGTFKTACCPVGSPNATCQYKRKDHAGVGYCPDVCVGWAGASAGTCTDNNPKENKLKSRDCKPSKFGRWNELKHKDLNLDKLCGDDEENNGPINCIMSGSEKLSKCKTDEKDNLEYCWTRSTFLKKLKNVKEKIVNLQEKFGPPLTKIAWEDLSKQQLNVDIIINATSLGLNNDHMIDLNFSSIDKKTIFYDVIYNPSETRLLQKAKKHGCHTVNGMKMFLYQAQLAFEIWNQIKPVIDVDLTNILAKKLYD